MRVSADITGVIGRTPVVRLSRFVSGTPDSGEVLVKLESANPGGSVKDRAALSMLNDAEERGALVPGGTIVEPTSGNTGVGLAMVAAARGYKLVLTMPDTMSIERRRLLAAYGAELVLTPGAQGMTGAVQAALDLARANPSWFMPYQFENEANPRVHERTTAREILEDLDGHLDAFVAGIGTGGTITGVGRALKRELPGVRIIGVEPAESPVLSGGAAGPHGIQGIGAGFVPKVLDRSVIDEIIAVRTADARAAARALARTEGVLAGISSGAAAWAAREVARRLGPGTRTLAILPDTGERYLSIEGLWTDSE
ncbi:MAG: Cysteine synthase [Firmicutes bacterium ADurb.Bin506]|nr:MAG: Cysteine synthase [Firmicutes bacterium ADurb.Bin506]